ncbi:MAG: hypothetical protein KBC84_05360 [Proteobacteria bacterium]|nr:hypothetical protein [Pseudomonadota bacterium]
MKAAIDAAKEAKLIFKTDRRFWAAGGFLICVILVWSMTTSWREVVPEKPREWVDPPKKEAIPEELVSSLLSDLKARKIARDEMHEQVKRTASDFQRGKEEIDANLSKLNDKLNLVGEKVNKMVSEIGESRVKSVLLQENINVKKKK